jgi:hypothetical protein
VAEALKYLGLLLVYVAVTVLLFVYVSIPLVLIGLGTGALAGIGLALVGTVAVLLGRVESPLLVPGGGGDATAGRLLRAPRDPAWLSYFAGQGAVDLVWGARRCLADVGRLWQTALIAVSEWGTARRDRAWGPWLLVLAFWPAAPPVFATLVGASAGAALTLVVVGAVVLAATLPVWLVGLGLSAVVRARDGLVQRGRRASVSCPRCFHVTRLPSYDCTGGPGAPGRPDRHADLRPGWRGVLWRRCAWGHQVPTGVLRAAKRLTARCPSCGYPLEAGAATRREVRVAVFGAASAGKTGFIVAGFAELVRSAPHRGTAVEPVDAAARQQYQDFQSLLDGRGTPAKTPTNAPPQVITARLRRRRRRSILRLFDVAGEVLADAEQHTRLAYFEHTRTLVFVLDPFAIPVVRDSVERTDAGLLREAGASGADPEESYNSTALRLRGHGVRTDLQRLAFVVSKADLLRDVPVARDLGPSSDAVRSWLRAQDLDNLVLAAERDFHAVRYFLSSMWLPAPSNALTPLRWLLSTEGLL